MAFRIQLRRDTASNWTTVDPVLLEGELGYETDTGLAKMGDGSTAWSGLAYWPNAIAGVNLYGPTGSYQTEATAFGLTGTAVTTEIYGSIPYYNVNLGNGFRAYAVRFDYSATDQLSNGDETILTASPWSSTGFSVAITSESDVKFTFANEGTPPKNILGYFYKATEDKYYLTSFGLGSVGYQITSVLGSTVNSNIASNDFFSDFGGSGHQIQLDLTASNHGGAQAGGPTIYIHSYVVFVF